MAGYLRIPNALRYSSEFTLTEKWLIASVGSWADGYKGTYVALAAELGMTQRWVISLVNSLEERGWLEVERGWGNTLKLTPECAAAFFDKVNSVHQEGELSSPRRGSKFTKKVNSVHQEGELSSPHIKNIKNNNKEKEKEKENGAGAPNNDFSFGVINV